ncbi:hypothetical protein SAY86_031438 [Trapa natans]|uniref:RING-type E3 ubiquitin transferase n=1 Tax=Trapa natans TaxID=22666 RepID=A0AAN7LRR3_TRANT|nr:hypothetical protein SAY86_031438 [Trapa natans]
MGDSDYGGLDDNTAVALTGKIMVIAIITLFIVVAFIMFLHLYARWFWWYVEEPSEAVNQRNRRRRRFVFAPGQELTTVAARRGLDPSVLRALPVVVFPLEEFKEGLECAVCLSELVEGEKARVLPKCSHGFHADCIDTWFQSNTTCPLCRNSVVGTDVGSDFTDASDTAESVRPSTGNMEESLSFQPMNYPTNVLFWGNDTEVSSRNACLEEGTLSSSSSGSTSEGILVIDIPAPGAERPATSLLSPSAGGCGLEEVRSPVMTRLRSLKWLLSREKKVVGPSTSGEDTEQGGQSLPC